MEMLQPTSGRRFVALLDVLGFRELVLADPTGDRIRRYLISLRNATQKTRVQSVVFSDSIVLTSDGDEPESLLDIVQACSRLFGAFLTEQIPLRGAIAFGQVIRESLAESVFVAGRAIIDAYKFEQDQNWVGVMIAPSTIKQVPSLTGQCRLPSSNYDAGLRRRLDDLQQRINWAAYVQWCTAIPFRTSNLVDSGTFEGFAIVPTNNAVTLPGMEDDIESALQHLRWLHDIAPSPAAQRKYDGTIEWLQKIKSDWTMLRQAQNYPAFS